MKETLSEKFYAEAMAAVRKIASQSEISDDPGEVEIILNALRDDIEDIITGALEAE